MFLEFESLPRVVVAARQKSRFELGDGLGDAEM